VWYAPSFPGEQPLQQSGGDISGTSHVITGLSSYTTSTGSRDDYKVQVHAKNADGRSAPSAEWNGDLLAVPGGWKIYLANSGDGRLAVDVDSYDFDYTVVYYSANPDDPKNGDTFVEGMRESDKITITELTNGITYYFWIQARTDAGDESDWSESVSATPHMPAPVITQVIPADASVDVYWGPVTSADSYPVFYEVWRYKSAGESAPGTKANEIDLPSSPYVITGLENDTEYTVYVKAKTQYDAVDSPVKTATPRPVPARPEAPLLTPGLGQIGASWDASSDTTVTAYAIYYHTANDYTRAVKYGEVTGTSVVIKGLGNNTAYYVWLRAKNEAGFSLYSPVAGATTPASGAITVGFDGGGLRVTDQSGTDLSGGFALGASESLTLNASGGFDAVNWHVDGILVAGSAITLNGASYNDYRDHSVTFAGTKGGTLYSSDPIPFRVTP
jgi:hypothetical protein